MLTFLHISDTHISADPGYHPPWIPDAVRHPNICVEALVDKVRNLPFAFEFILHTGDVCADPLTENYLCARELLGRFDGPMYMLPGNHDSPQLMIDILHDGETRHVLRDDLVPLNGYHLLSLDCCGEGDVHAPVVAEEKIETLASNLAAAQDQPIIFALHYQLLKVGVPWFDEEMRVQNGERIHDLLAARASQVAGAFHGHIHQQTSTTRDGVTYTCCPSTWSNLVSYPGLKDSEPDLDTPVGFNLVMIDDGTTYVRRFNLPAAV